MTLSGELFIGRNRSTRLQTFHGVNPATGETLQPAFSAADAGDVAKACELAAAAFDVFRETSSQSRAIFLETIADQILALGDELLERAHAESGLPLARLTGERGRTVGQLRLFADELRKGGWLGIRIDPALPDRKPLPRSDLRQRKIPLGPVVVFGASNFPLAFSVAGGDTAAALAAGCPVIVKGHSAHPGTSELVARAIVAAVTASAACRRACSRCSTASRNELGAALVAHPRIKAVGFTGSRAGGLALMKIAAANVPEPIPVYAEMSSINPVVLLPGALAARAEALGKEFVASLTLGVGTVLYQSRPGLRARSARSAALRRSPRVPRSSKSRPPSMLTPGIHAAYERGVERAAEAHKAVQSHRARRRSARQALRPRCAVRDRCQRSCSSIPRSRTKCSARRRSSCAAPSEAELIACSNISKAS